MKEQVEQTHLSNNKKSCALCDVWHWGGTPLTSGDMVSINGEHIKVLVHTKRMKINGKHQFVSVCSVCRDLYKQMPKGLSEEEQQEFVTNRLVYLKARRLARPAHRVLCPNCLYVYRNAISVGQAIDETRYPLYVYVTEKRGRVYCSDKCKKEQWKRGDTSQYIVAGEVFTTEDFELLTHELKAKKKVNDLLK